ncbi:1-(5-phosphoribosyl)-5-[(5-phosphoribosylamino)methylideneamino]imidazole-4-carboxamide isomerase [Aquifex aeolicus]|uniref:1-(5-phosphoribosyl)-5-[(5-phosphoribosylamino)methylideneamino] imidazole-4-carboxamide isomerase n=1 Tax=Aquifex aeolicus (strain VF5) TaxID=224324 RepID=HIS4_AQUAE|nr:1-(5-phosphoribosyl)-5-[(5-phosphoribosylamino)methylideneamino]imidazole-4-carboxamide isomerase [Aquifex aeolicus]O67328.1 RecName: Full=1-(5-phosphoribosyl)-5-[(5-phosphoribosylamino)methylideneamino] imidazole-4-carboxamide isomerase; AltName: Full=Phosphoribosylformimino-5-aminoimidazole carboxamide ribotide isomerase [Aquifex aeolicus VF5]AAC07284.1 phosphoribosylformimino-5-aminoimidazole carboxamide ribotide isomerase [Aquifex aeolicus VF5]
MNLKEFIIPAIDLMEGKAVRLYKGDFNKVKVYSERPWELAKNFSDLGFKRLHVVDLEGAEGGKPKNLEVIRKIRENFEGEVEVGGGIRSYEVAKALFDEGIDFVVIGTLAYKNKEEFLKILENFPNRVILAIDSKQGKVAIGGWKEETAVSPEEFAKEYENYPIWGYLYTVIERDGSLEGVDVEPYKEIKKHVKKPVIASGGVSSLEDIKKLYGIVEGVVVGKAIYEGRITLEDLQNF